MKLFFLLLLLAISSGFAFTDAFADVTIVPVAGSGAPGCESSGCYSPGAPVIEIGESVIFSNT
ncbi:MAG: PEFG-CTERM domain-containing protein, partial [Thaumarchaeota archaeon]|nr:PEFG-CTERM domain-containing protein [Nitrososphaerota archaeon]